MIKFPRAKTAVWILCGAVLLSACVLPERNDPFERLPEEPLETINGELFPFSVSVSTRATHRLERENKLVGYLTSDLVRLEDFEGQEVALEGVWRNDKMREIFWVESVSVKGAEKEEAPTELRFATKNFTFLYPSGWDYTETPDAKLYFVDKADPNRKVFLTLAIEEFSPEAERVDPNIVLSGIAGTKEVVTKDNGREQEIIRLFSNNGAQQYVFKADYAFDDFDRKRALLDLLESFIEGEEQVELVIEGDKIKQAEQEAAKIVENEELAALQAKAKLVDEVAEGTGLSFLDRLLKRSQVEIQQEKAEPIIEVPAIEASEEPIEVVEEVVVDEVEEVKEALEEVVAAEAVYDYKNIIEGRAYDYSSAAFGFAVKTPYGFWYQNFGGGNGSVFEMGFADNAIEGRGTVDFWLRGKAGVDVFPEPIATLDGDTLKIIKVFPGGHMEITGPVAFKDAMWSVLESVTDL